MSHGFDQVPKATADIRTLKEQILVCRAKIYAAEKKYIDARAELERVQAEQMLHIDELLSLAGNVMLNLGHGIEELPKARGFA